MSNLYRGPAIDASHQVSVHLIKRFQRRFLKIDQSETRLFLICLISKKSSPLNPLCQMNQNLVGSMSSIKIAHLVPIS
jgi:hypothetical protein